MDLPAKPAKKSKPVAIENSLRLRTRGIPAAAAESGVIDILLKLFFFKLPDLVHRRIAAPIAAENRR